MNIKEVKSSLRAEIISLLKGQQQQDRKVKSELINNKILELEALERKLVIMMYVSDEYEVETHSLIRKLLESGKRVVIPCLDEYKDIIPFEIKDLDNDTEVSWYGYLEPKRNVSQKPLPVDELDLVVVPGLAFDREGKRLGRGWGCYDRFLSKLPDDVPTVGLAFDFQIRPTIPATEHDKTVSAVISN